MSKLEKRVAALEKKLLQREIKEACAAGKHDWEMVQSHIGGNPPWVRCKHCCTNGKDTP